MPACCRIHMSMPSRFWRGNACVWPVWIVELIGGKPARVVRSTFATLTFDENGHMDLGTFTRQQSALAETALDPALVRTKPAEKISGRGRSVHWARRKMAPLELVGARHQRGRTSGHVRCRRLWRTCRTSFERPWPSQERRSRRLRENWRAHGVAVTWDLVYRHMLQLKLVRSRPSGCGQMAVLQRRQLVPAATNTREGLPTTKDPERSKTMRSLCLCRRKMRLLSGTEYR